MSEVTPVNVNNADPLAFASRVGKYSVFKDIFLKAFIKAVLKKGPQVIYFGEIHKDEPENYKSTLDRFNEMILPQLAKAGFTDLVLEYIPDDPEVEKELDRFYETGVLNAETAPKLLSTVSAYDNCAIIQTLMAARSLGIRVHGAYLSLTEIPQTIENPEYDSSPELQNETASLIAQHTLDQIKKLESKGAKFAIFGGLAHNDVKAGELAYMNTGEYLNGKYGKKYLEIDLIVPEALEDIPPESQGYVVPVNWKKLIPQKGVTVIQHANSYFLIFKKSCQITTLDFSAFFSCPLSFAPLCAQ